MSPQPRKALPQAGKRGLIQREYLPLLRDVIELARDAFGNNLLCVYVRGSVSTGDATPRYSDVDLVIVLSRAAQETRIRALRTDAEQVRRRYPFVPFVDTTVLTENELRADPHYAILRVNLKTRSVLLHGKDIVKTWPSVIAGRGLSRILHDQSMRELDDLLEYFTHPAQERTYLGEVRPARFWCVWAMRTFLRSTVGLVMLRTPIYTTDLRRCRDLFVRQHPSWAPALDRALVHAMHPSDDKKAIGAFLVDVLPAYKSLWDRQWARSPGKDLRKIKKHEKETHPR